MKPSPRPLRRPRARARAVGAALVSCGVLVLALAACPVRGVAPIVDDAGAEREAAPPGTDAAADAFVGERCPDGTLVGQCLRAVSCVAACGATPVQVGCCPCPAGTFDDLMCALDAGDAGDADLDAADASD